MPERVLYSPIFLRPFRERTDTEAVVADLSRVAGKSDNAGHEVPKVAMKRNRLACTRSQPISKSTAYLKFGDHSASTLTPSPICLSAIILQYFRLSAVALY